MRTIEEAAGIVLRHARPMPTETVALADALGRCLAAEIESDRDFPPTDRSAMDGFAVRSADTADPGATLEVVGELPAGRDARGIAVGPREAVRIMTGAVIPQGADAVVMVELTESSPDGSSVRILEAVERGQHVRRRAEDVAAGTGILAPGAVVGAAEVAALAAVGADPVPVFARPTVALLSTGDEIVPAATSPAPHQVRNSNALTLAAQLRELGIEPTDLGIVRDDLDGLRAAIGDGLERDVLVLTGGVSMGAYDLVGEALASCGVETLFHKVAMKPGKPILAGTRGDRMVFGLPGNPVSAFTGFAVFVAPFLRRRMGWRAWDLRWGRAVLTAPLRRRPGRTTFHLVRLDPTVATRTATPVRTTGSGDVLSMTQANGFAVTEPGRHEVEAGSEVAVLPW